MKSLQIKQIYIDSNVVDHQITRHVLKKLPEIPSIICNESLKMVTSPEDIKQDKKVLYLTEFKGAFCKQCPGTTEDYLCCNYYVINETTGCPLDCTYCILQDYLDSSVLKVFVNYEKIFEEIEELQQRFPDRLIRIGTGELSDSLALDSITGLSRHLVPFFTKRKNIIFELKTKTDVLPLFSPSQPPDNIVYSLSVNPEMMVNTVEHYAAALDMRLQSARKAEKLGFRLGFHFDPVIHHPHWKKLYGDLISQIFSAVSAESIMWISIGGLRFTPGLKDIIKERYPQSPLIRDEQVVGMDNKIRYFKPLRIEMFRYIYDCIRSYSQDVFVYFCMEDKKTWQNSFGFSPISTNHVDYLFAASIYKRFPGLNLSQPDLDYYLSLG